MRIGLVDDSPRAVEHEAVNRVAVVDDRACDRVFGSPPAVRGAVEPATEREEDRDAAQVRRARRTETGL